MTTTPTPKQTATGKTTVMQKVDQILADVAALPKEYRSLVTKIDAWETSYVAIAMAASFSAGVVATLAVRLFF